MVRAEGTFKCMKHIALCQGGRECKYRKVRGEGTPFFGAKGRIIDRLSVCLFVHSLAQMVITYLPQRGVEAKVDIACDFVSTSVCLSTS